MPRLNCPPKLGLHRASGQAGVHGQRNRHNLGKYGSRQAQAPFPGGHQRVGRGSRPGRRQRHPSNLQVGCGGRPCRVIGPPGPCVPGLRKPRPTRKPIARQCENSRSRTRGSVDNFNGRKQRRSEVGAAVDLQAASHERETGLSVEYRLRGGAGVSECRASHPGPALDGLLCLVDRGPAGTGTAGRHGTHRDRILAALPGGPPLLMAHVSEPARLVRARATPHAHPGQTACRSPGYPT